MLTAILGAISSAVGPVATLIGQYVGLVNTPAQQSAAQAQATMVSREKIQAAIADAAATGAHPDALKYLNSLLQCLLLVLALSSCTVTPSPVYDTQAPLQYVLAQVYPDKSADLTPFGVSVYNATVAYYGRDTYFKPPESPLPAGVVHLTPQQLEDFGVMRGWHNVGYVPNPQ
jgi:hypothetical protein